MSPLLASFHVKICGLTRAVDTELAIDAVEDVEFLTTYPGTFARVDARIVGQRRGNGERIDPKLVAPRARARSHLLAGALRPENVADAVCPVRPRGADVVSRVETHLNIKDQRMMHAFVAEIPRAAREIFQVHTENE